MIIRSHTNGTYSITDMTRDDLDNLAFGACTAVAFHASQVDKGDSPEWHGRRQAIMNLLERQIRRVLPRYDGVSSKRRVEVVSDTFGNDGIYEEVV
jgi:hypothetical protein